MFLLEVNNLLLRLVLFSRAAAPPGEEMNLVIKNHEHVGPKAMNHPNLLCHCYPTWE